MQYLLVKPAPCDQHGKWPLNTDKSGFCIINLERSLSVAKAQRQERPPWSTRANTAEVRGRSPPLPHTEHGTERPTTDSSRSLASWLTGKASREPSLGRGAARHCCGRRMQPSERGSAHGAAAPRGAGLPPPSHRTAADAQPRAQRRSGLTRLILPFKTNQAFYVRNFPSPHLASRAAPIGTGSGPAGAAGRAAHRSPAPPGGAPRLPAAHPAAPGP